MNYSLTLSLAVSTAATLDYATLYKTNPTINAITAYQFAFSTTVSLQAGTIIQVVFP